MIVIRPCDVETTSLDITIAEVIEVASYDMRGEYLYLYTSGWQTLVKPAAPIPASSSGIHHITDADVADAPAWNEAWKILIEPTSDPDYADAEIVYAAHMASYERHFLDPLIKARWIDTWRCALRQWPDLENHKLQTIRYALKLPADPMLAMPPHRAAPDAYLCGLLVLELLKHQDLETLIRWSGEPPVFSKFDFGMFKGKPLSAADDGWLDWLANKEHTMGADWRWNAKREIARRAAAVRQGHLDAALAAIPTAGSVRDLENWWITRVDQWMAQGIVPGTAEHGAILAACAARKKALLEAGEPQFGATA